MRKLNVFCSPNRWLCTTYQHKWGRANRLQTSELGELLKIAHKSDFKIPKFYQKNNVERFHKAGLSTTYPH